MIFHIEKELVSTTGYTDTELIPHGRGTFGFLPVQRSEAISMTVSLTIE